MKPKESLIVALDVDTQKKALAIVGELEKDVRFFKVGLELFSSCGPGIVSAVKKKGCEVFLDLKFHDIPTTAAKAAVAVTRLGAYMFNLHALGGYDMMKQAKEAAEAEAERLSIRPPKIIAVTILTSMDKNSLKKLGISGSIEKQVLRLAQLAKDAGLDGVVASPAEIKSIKREIGDDFLVVTPGVRPISASANDQKRIATPHKAVRDGADFIVVGRPITGAPDRRAAARAILDEIGR